MVVPEEEELRRTLVELQQEHRDLDRAIAALEAQTSSPDQLLLKRLKKKKLLIRDKIQEIEDILFPDIIA